MKRLLLIAACAGLSTTPSALAALASPYQRAAELTAAIEAAVGVLDIYTIESVRFLNADQYEVRTLNCTVIVDIVDTAGEDEPIIIGRRQFEAVAQKPRCEQSPVSATEDIRWFGSADAYGASLVYGIPDSGYAPIAFFCTNGADLAFAYEFEPIDPTDGGEVTVTLQVGDIIVPIETTGLRLEMDDLFILEGTTILDDRLTDLLTSRGTLHVFVEDGSAEYPLDGAREAASSLIEYCRG